MLLRTFTGNTAAEAMAQVRKTLGEDAIILSTQDDDDGGVRVTAALEPDALPAVKAAAPKAGNGWKAPPVAELEAADRIAEVLDHHRVPRGLADRLLTVAAGHPTGDWMMAFAAALDHYLGFTPLGDLGPERPVMLIGPSGAGKSITAAKLCACARLAEARSLLITMDAGKAGGRAQAETFTRALDARLAPRPLEDLHVDVVVFDQEKFHVVTLPHVPTTRPKHASHGAPELAASKAAGS